MGNLTYYTGTSSNWESLWSGSFIAPPAPGDSPALEKYYPIDPIAVPVLLSSDLCAFYASSTDAKAHWRFAASVDQRIQTGIFTGGSQDAVVASKRIWLDQVSILRFGIHYQSTYSLVVRVPYWIRKIDLHLWQYIGQIEDSYTDKMNAIHNDLLTLIND